MDYDFWDDFTPENEDLDSGVLDVPEGWDIYSYERVYPPMLLAMTPVGWWHRLWRKLRGWRRVLSANELEHLIAESPDGEGVYDAVWELQCSKPRRWHV